MEHDPLSKVYNASVVPMCGTALLIQVDTGSKQHNADSDDNLLDFIAHPDRQQLRVLGRTQCQLVLNQKSFTQPKHGRAKV